MANLIQRAALSLARFAGYEAAEPTKGRVQASRVGINPDSSFADSQRRQLSLEGIDAVKNTSFGRAYIGLRRAYCSSRLSYHPDTGDAVLDQEIQTMLEEEWAFMGVECSMQESFSRAADVFLPTYGDSALQWYRDENGLRLLEVTGDRIGEPFGGYLNSPQQEGEKYVNGLYMRGPNVVGYKIYERNTDFSSYTNATRVPASEIIFFKDDIDGGMRGVSIFATAMKDMQARHDILKATKDTMQAQSKTFAIASNNSGSANEYDIQTQTNAATGSVEYVESYGDGAQLRYQFNGDNFQVLKAEHPSESFISAIRYLDESGALSVNMPYCLMFNSDSTGGAGFRGQLGKAALEIQRIRSNVHRPRLMKISKATILDLVARGRITSDNPNVLRGSWRFGTLPTADAFRDDKSDIEAIRAGIRTRAEVVAANSDQTFAQVLRATGNEAVAIHQEVQLRNLELEAVGLEPTITITDIALSSDNPAAPPASAKTEAESEAEAPPEEEPESGEDAKQKAAFAGWDESKHPRNPSGDDTGGEFAGNGGKSGAGDSEKPKRVLSKGEQKTEAMRQKLAGSRAKAEAATQKLAEIRSRIDALKSGDAAPKVDANADIKSKLADMQKRLDAMEKMKTQTKEIDRSLASEDRAADKHGYESPQAKKAREKTKKLGGAALAEWDESKHPRNESGPDGGEFKRKLNPSEEFEKKHNRKPTFQELHGAKGGLIEKLDTKTGGKGAITDVTPKGFGPSDDGASDSESRLYVDPVKMNDLKSSISEAKTLLKGKLTPEKAAQIKKSLANTEKRLADLMNHEPASAALSTWDESKHPRHGAGDENGGEFAAKSISELSVKAKKVKPASAFPNASPKGQQPLDQIDVDSAEKTNLHSSILHDVNSGIGPDGIVRFEHPGQMDRGLHYWKDKISKGERPAILVGGEKNLKVYDGNHRAAAYKDLGIENIPVLFTDKAMKILKARKAEK